MLHPVRYRVEYVAFRTFAALLSVLPLPVAQTFAWCLGRFVYACFLGSRRREAIRRLRLVLGPDASEADIRRAAWISFRNVLFNAIEMLRIRRIHLKDLQRMIENSEETIGSLRALLSEANGRGVILALPHCGNWDLAGSLVFLSGIPIFSVAGKQRNPYMNDLMNKMRSGHGMDILERGESGGRTYVQMLRRVRGGDVFAILPDSRSRTPALSIPFLGGTANLARGMGLLSVQSGAPIIPLVMRRVSWRRFRFELFPVLRPDPAADRDAEELRLTKTVVAHIDEAIRKTPEQWFWYNKRWVLDPVENLTAK